MKSNGSKETKTSRKNQARSEYKWAKHLSAGIEQNKARIIELFDLVIENTRLRIALEIERCKDCTAKILDLEPPIIFHDGDICKKHEAQLEEFNRRFASN